MKDRPDCYFCLKRREHDTVATWWKFVIAEFAAEHPDVAFDFNARNPGLLCPECGKTLHDFMCRGRGDDE